ncbi:gb [Venturia nashicola]|uniref:Glycine cleavage system H protein n=1 Tax=Venturia nashicola TaxID=86259 RepID=A0A4Z1NTN0_9PEZI|nr:gb [Venturia nashicola]TLD29790.1 gb [Venturia nashicola]
MAARFSIARLGRLAAHTPLPRTRYVHRDVTTCFKRPQRAFTAGALLKVKQYTEDHEWIEVNGTTVTLGISAYAAEKLGDVIYVELPEASLEIGAGDAVGAVESVKSASDILTPVGGKVIESNSILEEKPGLLNQDPEGEGWITKIEVEGNLSVEGLMDKEGYTKFTEEAE